MSKRPEPLVNSSGFSLIEVLITLLILAIGLLGIAALQYRGLQYSHDAYLRSQVNILAYDIADRMRLNRASAPAYATAVTNYAVPVSRPGGCTLTGSGSAQDVDNDVTCWQQQLYDALPPGSTANIERTDATREIYEVTLAWTDRDGTQHNVAYSFGP